VGYSRIMVPGGAGFVGSNLAIRLRNAYTSADIVVLDSLRRRGAELNVPRLRERDIVFVHGDVRCQEDIAVAGEGSDLIVDCCAEPSVLAGLDGSPSFVIQTNLGGTANCLEHARRHNADFVFLSTSRVYPIRALNSLAFHELPTRYEFAGHQNTCGVSERGISERFPLTGYRSLYGAAKLASEMLIEEYHQSFGLRTLINRCGVIAGPWQMGKVDQGIFAHWIFSHVEGTPLSYFGYGGSGKQVRDVLHVDDLADLIEIELRDIDRLSGSVFNVGGGMTSSLSLLEATVLSQEIVGKKVRIAMIDEERPLDVRMYITDNDLVRRRTGWEPRHSARETLTDLYEWATSHRAVLEAVRNG
jgi:CDP-paratose 2-epimerase